MGAHAGAVPAGSWAAVLGHPIGHSLSPVMHRAAYRVLGAQVEYEARDVEVEGIESVMRSSLSDPGWRGFSITMPLKSAARAYADELTDLAEAVGVINTLARPEGPEGPVVGHNTDVSGIVNALLRAGAGSGSAPTAAIIGGGGTATAAAAALRILGAEHLTVFVRDAARAGRVAQTADRLGVPLRFEPLDDAARRFAEFDVVVSTLPARAFDDYAAEIPADTQRTAVLDVSYDPWPSALAEVVSRRGGRPVSGREMLLYQAVDQIKMFFGIPLGEDLPDQAAVVEAMSAAVGLPPRREVPRKVWDREMLRSVSAVSPAESSGHPAGDRSHRDHGEKR